MMKLSMVAEADHPELAGLFTKIRAGRGGRYSYPYKLLLHSPAIAAAWLEQVSAVRWGIELDAGIREIAIIRVAILTRVNYVKKAHAEVYAEKAGLTHEQMAALESWENSQRFSPAQRAALAYIDAMTIQVQVPEAVQDGLQMYFNERQIIELTVLVGTYNMHCRVFQALEIERRSEIDKGEPSSKEKNSFFQK